MTPFRHPTGPYHFDTMSKAPTIKLNNGLEMPMQGLGYAAVGNHVAQLAPCCAGAPAACVAANADNV
jgi:hypothetical protein